MSRQVFRARSPLAAVGCLNVLSQSSGLFSFVPVTGGSVLRAGRHCCGALAVLAEKRGLSTHPPTLPDQRVTNNRVPPFGLRAEVGVPGSDSCGKGCWFEASDCHPRIGDSVGWLSARPGNYGCFLRALGVAPAASLRCSSELRLVWVGRLTALSYKFIPNSRIHCD